MVEYDKQYEETIEKLNEEYPIESIVKFNDLNIQEKLKDSAFLILHYKGLYLKEKNQLDRIGTLRDKIIGERFDFYRFNYEKELRTNEIKDYYLPKDEKIIRINRLYQKQQWRVDFFEAATEALIQQGWRMKSFLDEKRT
jgi:hypothetical protein